MHDGAKAWVSDDAEQIGALLATPPMLALHRARDIDQRGFDIPVRQIAEALDFSRPSQEIALRLIAEFIFKKLQLVRPLDPFCQHLKFESTT